MLIRFFSVLLFCGSLAIAQESGELFRNVQSQLNRLLDDGKLEEAASMLDQQVAAHPDVTDLPVLRLSIAARMRDAEAYQDALAQYEKIVDQQLAGIDVIANQYGLQSTLINMREVADRIGADKTFSKAVNRVFETMNQLDTPAALSPMSQIIVLKAQLLEHDRQTEEATALIDRQLEKLHELNQSDAATESTMTAQIRFLFATTTPDRENDPWRDDHIDLIDTVVSEALDRFPQSRTLQNDYAKTQLLMISEWQQDDPDATKQRIEFVTKQLEPLALRNRSLQAAIRRIEMVKNRMAAAKSVDTLVGKPAPPIDVDAWVNAGDTTMDSLKGKVVLIDFWAMWCGPCISTFPHLREWLDEFGPQGFQIVGITQYYNFQWDADAKRAARSGEPVDPVDERETIAQFLDHYELKHPTIVTPKDSDTGSSFGVRGIPHVVLLDRQGVVRFIKTGAGPQAAEEIKAKIKELLTQTPEDKKPDVPQAKEQQPAGEQPEEK